MSFAEINGTRLYYEVVGEGEPLILLHSGYTDSRLWDDQIAIFKNYFSVIRYDIRGFGRSDRPEEPFSHVEDLKALMEYLDLDSAHLLGVSMGGSIAIDFTLTYPEMVQSLVLSGPSLSGYAPVIDEASRKRSIAGMSIVRRDGDFKHAVEFMLADPMWRQSRSEAHRRLESMFMDTSLKWLLNDLVSSGVSNAAERLGKISKRALLIIGSEDSSPIQEIASVLESGITDLKRVVISDTGHLPSLDKPEVFNQLALNFLLNKEAK